jgi:transcriptional regulator with XRE-family HTH domain
MRTTPPLPLPVKRALTKLGSDIKDARLRRRISTVTMAERAFITRTTLGKAENGDPTVSMGTYAILLYVLGISDRLIDLADISQDDVGLQLDSARLPKRIRESQ